MMLKVAATLVLFLSVTAGGKIRKEPCQRMEDNSITICDNYMQQCCNDCMIHGNDSRCTSDKDGRNVKIYMNQCHVWQARCRDPSVCILKRVAKTCEGVSDIEPYSPPACCLTYPMLPAKDASHNINLPCRQPRHQPKIDVTEVQRRSIRRLLGISTYIQPDCNSNDGSCGYVSLEPRVCNRTENIQPPPRIPQCLELSATSTLYRNIQSTR